MNRIKNLNGVAKYVVWAFIGFVIGGLYALVAAPFFRSGFMPIWLVTGALGGLIRAFSSDMRAFSSERRARKVAELNQP